MSGTNRARRRLASNQSTQNYDDTQCGAEMNLGEGRRCPLVCNFSHHILRPLGHNVL
jgi:hypothetical protein